jgi:hypothetical protein
MNKTKTEIKTNGAKSSSTRKAAQRKEPGFKVDNSPAARAFAKAVRLTHKRLYGEK